MRLEIDGMIEMYREIYMEADCSELERWGFQIENELAGNDNSDIQVHQGNGGNQSSLQNLTFSREYSSIFHMVRWLLTTNILFKKGKPRRYKSTSNHGKNERSQHQRPSCR